MPPVPFLTPLVEPLSPISDGVSDKTLCYVDYEADSEESEPHTPVLVLDDSRLPFGRISRVWNHYCINPSSSGRRYRDSSPDPFDSSPWYRNSTPPRSRRRPRTFRLVCYVVAALLMVLGAYHTLETILDPMPWLREEWLHYHSSQHHDSPTSPACHSHNDYLQHKPLFSALRAGCSSIEADVWLLKDEIYVGHTTGSLTADRTLRSLYLEPIMALVDKQNPNSRAIPDAGEARDVDHLRGIFNADPTKTLVLLVDFKTAHADLWDLLLQQLTPLRERGYLSYFNGSTLISRPITIVASGSAPFGLLTANATYRDVFYDAPLDKLLTENSNDAIPKLKSEDGLISAVQDPDHMAGDFHANNSYFASVSFTKSIGYMWGSTLSERQLHLLRAQIHNAHQLGLKVRYWDTPSGWRMQRILVDEGVDFLNTDDVSSYSSKGRRCSRWFC